MPMKSDWLLFAIAASRQGMLSPVQVQKAMFVFRKGAEGGLPEDSFYDFKPYDYGPFDSTIYQDLNTFEGSGLIQTLNKGYGAQRRYTVTAAGRERAEKTRATSAQLADYITQVVQWVESKSFVDLVRAVYDRWPEYRVNSVFVDTHQG